MSAPKPPPERAARAAPLPVRIAVVGLGYWGPNLVRNLHEVPRPRSPASATAARGRSRAIRRRYPAIAGRRARTTQS